MLRWLTDLFTGRTRAQRTGGEPDVEPDPAQVDTRPTGGVADPDAADAHSTTSPSENDTFVGRVAGEDAGDAGDVGTTGAEARSEGPPDTP